MAKPGVHFNHNFISDDSQFPEMGLPSGSDEHAYSHHSWVEGYGSDKKKVTGCYHCGESKERHSSAVYCSTGVRVVKKLK